MSQIREKNVSSVDAKKNDSLKAGTTTPVRIARKTKERLEQLLRQVNKDRIGRRIKIEDVLRFSLDLLTDDHIREICHRSLSNKDRMELLYRKLSKEQPGITRDEFFGMLLDGRASI
jgi:hypothetical protein